MNPIQDHSSSDPLMSAFGTNTSTSNSAVQNCDWSSCNDTQGPPITFYYIKDQTQWRRLDTTVSGGSISSKVATRTQSPIWQSFYINAVEREANYNKISPLTTRLDTKSTEARPNITETPERVNVTEQRKTVIRQRRKKQAKPTMGNSEEGQSFERPNRNGDSSRIKRKRKRHYCTECNGEFSDAHSVKVHFRIHSGEKPFICTLCDKNFRQKAHLDKHGFSKRHLKRKAAVEAEKE